MDWALRSYSLFKSHFGTSIFQKNDKKNKSELCLQTYDHHLRQFAINENNVVICIYINHTFCLLLCSYISEQEKGQKFWLWLFDGFLVGYCFVKWIFYEYTGKSHQDSYWITIRGKLFCPVIFLRNRLKKPTEFKLFISHSYTSLPIELVL